MDKEFRRIKKIIVQFNNRSIELPIDETMCDDDSLVFQEKLYSGMNSKWLKIEDPEKDIYINTDHIELISITYGEIQ